MATLGERQTLKLNVSLDTWLPPFKLTPYGAGTSEVLSSQDHEAARLMSVVSVLDI